MNFLEALSTLHADHCPCFTADATVDLRCVCLLTEGGEVDDPHALYLCPPEQLPLRPPEDDAVYNFLVLDSAPTTLPSHISRLNVAYLGASQDPGTVMNTLSQALGEELHLHSVMRTITQALFSNKGLQSLIDTAYTVFQNPILVVDISGKIIARAPEQDGGEPKNAFEAQILRPDYAEPPLQSLLDDAAGMEEPASGEGPYSVIHGVFGCDAMVGSIHVRGIGVGWVVLFAQERPFRDVERHFFNRLVSVVAQELQKKALFTQNRNEVKAFLLNDLLSMENISPATMDARLRQAGFKPSGKFYVGVVEVAGDSARADGALFNAIADQLYPVLWGGLYLVRSTELVILFNLDEDKDVSGYINQQLTHQAVSNHLVIGMSNMFRDLTAIKRHYEQAKRAVAIGSRYNRNDVIYFALAAPVELLHVVRQHDEIMDFCVAELQDLLELDRETGSNLLETLYFYLELSGNTAEAARVLRVHKNTLLYRLSKIKQIIHCDLTRGEDIFRLMLSFRILRIQRIFDPPTSKPEFNIDAVDGP